MMKTDTGTSTDTITPPSTAQRLVQLVRRHRRWLIAGGIFLALALLASCGVDDYKDERGKGDAPVGSRDDSEAEVINMPDGFSNVSHKCDGHGHRVYVTTTNDKGKELVVIDDESCGGSTGG